MTANALVTPFVALMAAAAWMSTPSANAGPQAAGTAEPAARQTLARPESPAAAFERLLAARTPAPSPAVAPDGVDPLQPLFRAALWRARPPAALETATGPSPEVRK